ncbi:hypothetical protein GQ600_15033 [Phytophthora cactorum]|nr:hypothetical protein GQ600_15033 [Phytophthora cactorum]
MLLKQTIADEPYKQEHGKVMEQWRSWLMHGSKP